MAPVPDEGSGKGDMIETDDMIEKTTTDDIRAGARTEAKVEALTETIRELKKTIEEIIRELRRTIEEVVDRVDADVDSIREKTSSIAVTAAAVDDLKRRVTVLETKLDANSTEHAVIKAVADDAVRRVTLLETKTEALQYRVWFVSGTIGVLAWIASRLFK